ncbi:MAG TPA: hypothetical protein VGF89_03500 [Steroidobacteraceae bacterium]
MGRLLIFARQRLGTLVLLAVLAPVAAAASDFGAVIDLRAVAADGLTSFLDGGLGDLRFDDQHDGLRLGSVSLFYNHAFFDIVHVNVDAVAYDDHDRNLVDLTQIFAELRPFPSNGWRSRYKLGAFYAPISLENRLQGWRSAYSISPSAINTWIGEELRTLGAEYDLDWLGRQRGHDWGFGATAAVFGWNDYSGELLSQRGWAIHDRQTTLFGLIGQPNMPPVGGLREFTTDADQRPGYYAGLNAEYRDQLELRVLHYDNEAKTEAYSFSQQDFGWRTWFNSAGVRWTPTAQWTVIAQWINGITMVGDSGFENNILTDYYRYEFHAAFLLASWQHGPDRLTARYDDFEMHQNESDDFFNRNRGHAWTLAYERDLSRHWSVALEALQIDSSLASRSQIGEPVNAAERELQLAVRLQL